MKTLTCIIFLAVIAVRFCTAADAPKEESAAPASAAPAPAAAEVSLEVKNKSSFVMEESGRNPFWPIGWKPAAKAISGGDRVGPEVRESAFLVSSITMDQGARYAIINGKVMTEGQVFGLQMGGQTYQITVKSIQDGQVVLLRRDQEIAVPLRRR